MNLSTVLDYAKRPVLYEKGSAVMWTDPHISEQLLQIHLNPDIDLASRKPATIEKTIEWILTQVQGMQLNILDLGCGPGLYTEKLAHAGHIVTGVDFSAVSIKHAKQSAKNNSLPITYLQQNYLNLDVPDGSFDLVTLIYTDIGVLNPEDRDTLLQNIHAALKPGGIFIFDVLNDKDLEAKVSPKNWEASEGGFWRKGTYIALSESLLYQKEKVILNQHIVQDEVDTRVYRFWTHFFSDEKVARILKNNGFRNYSFHRDVLPEGDIWNGDNVTFCKTIK